MGLDDVSLIDATRGLDRVLGDQLGPGGTAGALREIENQLPGFVTEQTDESHRELDRQVGQDPFDLAEPVMLDHDDPILHVANRAAYGPTPSLVHDIQQSGGPRMWLARQLRPERIDDSEADELLASFHLLHRSGRQLRNDPLISGGTIARELRAATLLRAVWSRRQLFEVMTQFWSDHFSVSIGSGGVLWHKPWEDQNVIRPNAMGTFENLLLADAASPAMLLYLDQATSRAPDVNENYARELLELHTVGVDGGYDEADVRQAAHAFAGWTIDWETQSFKFRDQWHDPRPLRVMGWSHPGGTSVERGRSLLRYLAHHPSTARHLARKLAVRFVSEQPSAGLVNTLATTIQSARTAIVPVLDELFSLDEFWESRGARIRRPTEQYAAWLRGLQPRIDVRRGGDSDGAKSLDWTLRRLGHSPFDWPAPNGYPEAAGYWSGAALVTERWSISSRLVRNQLAGVEVDVPRLVEGTTTVQEAIDQLAARLTSRTPTRRERSALAKFAGGGDRAVADMHPDEVQHLVQLVLVLPSLQWR